MDGGNVASAVSGGKELIGKAIPWLAFAGGFLGGGFIEIPLTKWLGGVIYGHPSWADDSKVYAWAKDLKFEGRARIMGGINALIMGSIGLAISRTVDGWIGKCIAYFFYGVALNSLVFRCALKPTAGL